MSCSQFNGELFSFSSECMVFEFEIFFGFSLCELQFVNSFFQLRLTLVEVSFQLVFVFFYTRLFNLRNLQKSHTESQNQEIIFFFWHFFPLLLTIIAENCGLFPPLF